MPRDIFDAQQGIVATIAPIQLAVRNNGLGADFSAVNDIAAAGTATITLDKNHVITLVPGQAYSMSNVLFAMIEVAGAGLILDLYWAGWSDALLEEAAKR